MAASSDDAVGSRRRRTLRQCMTCGRTFFKADHLERHIRSHTKEKPFRCVKCGKRYGRHDTLLRHERDHPENVSDAETSCSQLFSTTIVTPTSDKVTEASGVEHVTVDISATGHNSTSKQTEDLIVNFGTVASMDMTSLEYNSDRPGFRPIQPQPNVSNGEYPSYNANQVDGSFDLGLDAMDFEAQFPSWMVDIDLNAGNLDTPLVMTMAELRPGWLDSPLASHGVSTYKPSQNMQRLWFTAPDESHEEFPPSGPATPLTTQADQVVVDDSYRQTLHQSLQIRSMDQNLSSALPSTDFLNLCVRSYFARFHPVFPVVHAPTFRPSKANSMVLLSICSVGSLFTGSSHAIRQGVQIFERLHKAVLANWDRLIARGKDEKISLIQTAIIGQTFGLLSGEPKHLAIVDAFNGTLISWARRLSTFKTRKLKGLSLDLLPTDLEKCWREWAKNEELIRIALAVHIHDAELASIFHHEPFLRHNSRQLPVAASHEMFSAARPDEWRQAYLNDPSNFESEEMTPASIDAHIDFDISSTPRNSCFTAYTILEGICVNIVECRIDGRSSLATIEEISELLTTFYGHFMQATASLTADHMDMTILWHLAYISISADFDLLERAIGREGSDLSPEDQLAVRNWANSDQAKRCVIHGSLVQKKLENLPLGSEPAIHVPRAMFRAGIAWFCYTRFGIETGVNKALAAENLEFPEFKLLGVNPALLLFQANGYKHGRPTAAEVNAALCGLTDLLRRIGHWEIARRFAAILGALLHDEAG
ncbi:early growth response protein [Exophiala viscosa]|uniref:early growth response protein n=1 Tax=Exophiala viscosa TaxID=2486360 RepID=UPI002195BB2D|nr:early growth response protein [Exophiala viscosa]